MLSAVSLFRTPSCASGRDRDQPLGFFVPILNEDVIVAKSRWVSCCELLVED